MSALEQLKGGLVVSCQPVDDGPMDDVDIIVAMAKAAVVGGAAGLRIEGVEKVRAVCNAVSVPVIGIVKRDLSYSPVRITVSSTDVCDLANAGAKIVAVDATDRLRPESFASLVDTAMAENVLLMADCATFEDGKNALQLGANIIGTTLSGYTDETMSDSSEPDFSLLSEFAEISTGTKTIVMGEGRFNSPELVAKAMQGGASCVTVGSAITRIEHIVGWFTDAIENAES